MSTAYATLSIAGKPLTKPFSEKGLKRLDKVSVIIPITLAELISLSLDELNNIMDDKILGGNIDGSLEDIHYSIVGHQIEDTDTCVEGIVFIWVRAKIARY